jgi:RES domain
MTARLPGPPATAELRAIGIRDDEQRLVSTDELWRVHRTTEDHVLAWSAFRARGPHPLPARRHGGIGVWYGANGPLPALAEAFQADRTIVQVTHAAYATRR